MNKLFSVLALFAAVLGGALVIRVQRFVPRQIDVTPAAPIQIDADAAAQRLSRAIRHRTVSPADSASQAEFERFHCFSYRVISCVASALGERNRQSAQPALHLARHSHRVETRPATCPYGT
jgi:hypothetical protein